MFSMTVQGSTGNTYEIKQGRDGVVYCSCPAWRYQRQAAAVRTCKHTRQVAAQFAHQMAASAN